MSWFYTPRSPMGASKPSNLLAVPPFINWMNELIDRARQVGVQVDPLSPMEIEEFVK